MEAEDFRVESDRDGDQELRCADYGEGCWWTMPVGQEWIPNCSTTKLGDLLELARKHIVDKHS